MGSSSVGGSRCKGDQIGVRERGIKSGLGILRKRTKSDLGILRMGIMPDL